MNYIAALKTVKASKPTEQYVVITLGYDNKLVMTHKNGIALMDALNSVEQLNETYGQQVSIGPMERGKIRVEHMPVEEYQLYKIAALMGMTIEDVKWAAKSVKTAPESVA